MADFGSWAQENLASLAHELNDENIQLREDIAVLRSAWRELVKEKYLGAVLAASPSHSSPSQ